MNVAIYIINHVIWCQCHAVDTGIQKSALVVSTRPGLHLVMGWLFVR